MEHTTVQVCKQDEALLDTIEAKIDLTWGMSDEHNALLSILNHKSRSWTLEHVPMATPTCLKSAQSLATMPRNIEQIEQSD